MVKDKITMGEEFLNRIRSSLDGFINWLEDYGETSWDHQSYYAGPIGGKAKALYYKRPLLGKLAVAPMIFSEALLPSARQLFWKRQRLPISDAHYAMGFAFLSQIFDEKKYYEKAVHFLNVLEQARCPGYQHYCWGYPFDWVTGGGTIAKDTPLITATPYVYEALLQIYEIDKNEKWLEIAHSIAEHVMYDLKDFEYSPDANTCAYHPYDKKGGVINATAYRAVVLTSASIQSSEKKYWEVAEKNLNFVLQTQQSDGSWNYDIGQRVFIDHFHTCFNLKSLAKIEQMLGGHQGCKEAIEKGVEYYLKNLFDDEGLPKPFSREPRLTVYKQELYNYAECINLGVLLKNRFSELDKTVTIVIEDVLTRWQKPDGSFRCRKLLFGWDNVPMHRWALSQLFRSLCFLLYQEKQKQ